LYRDSEALERWSVGPSCWPGLATSLTTIVCSVGVPKDDYGPCPTMQCAASKAYEWTSQCLASRMANLLVT